MFEGLLAISIGTGGRKISSVFILEVYQQKVAVTISK
jgi:hypothetical protein